jgi:hypothetical protein
MCSLYRKENRNLKYVRGRGLGHGRGIGKSEENWKR